MHYSLTLRQTSLPPSSFPIFFLTQLKSVRKMRSRKVTMEKQRNETVTFLLRIPGDLWQSFIKTVPISRTRHDFILDLIQRRVWEYDKAAKKV